MIKRISFALIDAKDCYNVVKAKGFPKTRKNVILQNEMETEYLTKLKKLQTEIEVKYFSQFEQAGEEISQEDFDEIDFEYYKDSDSSLDHLYYT